MIKSYFEIDRHKTSIWREVLAGITTFLTMAYILFVNPAMVSTDFAGNSTGLSYDAALLATCVATAIATLIMGLYANYPIALAPGMGHNALFVVTVMSLTANGISDAWQTTLGIVFIAGTAFLVLSLLGVREAIIDMLSASLRSAIAVSIGLFIAFIGLRNGGIVIDDAATLTGLNTQGAFSADWAVFWVGFLVTAVLVARGTPGAILWGTACGVCVAWLGGKLTAPESLIGLPQSNALFQLDLRSAFSLQCVPFILVFFYLDLFDTVGTLIGVTEQAGLSTHGKIPRLKRALMADAVGTVAGATLGTSTVTCYIESAAGVQQGGRTGLTAVTVAILFLLALPFAPIIAVIGSYPPIAAPALVVVGAMMTGAAKRIEWDDASEAIPAFLIILGVPLFFSIADGIAIGLIVYPILKLACGKVRDIKPAMVVLAFLLIVYLFYQAGQSNI